MNWDGIYCDGEKWKRCNFRDQRKNEFSLGSIKSEIPIRHLSAYVKKSGKRKCMSNKGEQRVWMESGGS